MQDPIQQLQPQQQPDSQQLPLPKSSASPLEMASLLLLTLVVVFHKELWEFVRVRMCISRRSKVQEEQPRTTEVENESCEELTNTSCGCTLDRDRDDISVSQSLPPNCLEKPTLVTPEEGDCYPESSSSQQDSFRTLETQSSTQEPSSFLLGSATQKGMDSGKAGEVARRLKSQLTKRRHISMPSPLKVKTQSSKEETLASPRSRLSMISPLALQTHSSTEETLVIRNSQNPRSVSSAGSSSTQRNSSRQNPRGDANLTKSPMQSSTKSSKRAVSGDRPVSGDRLILERLRTPS
jgi:hypothetical protein